MKKLFIELDHLKECVGSHRYEAKGEPIHTIYIQKSALDGPAPKRILISVQEVD